MPRPPSDLKRYQLMLSPKVVAALDAIALHRGWLNERGEPSRSRAARELVLEELARIQKKKQKRKD